MAKWLKVELCPRLLGPGEGPHLGATPNTAAHWWRIQSSVQEHTLTVAPLHASWGPGRLLPRGSLHSPNNLMMSVPLFFLFNR